LSALIRLFFSIVISLAPRIFCLSRPATSTTAGGLPISGQRHAANLHLETKDLLQKTPSGKAPLAVKTQPVVRIRPMVG
jgi:hypothetical protein